MVISGLAEPLQLGVIQYLPLVTLRPREQEGYAHTEPAGSTISAKPAHRYFQIHQH
jgi:hypothetical protein